MMTHDDTKNGAIGVVFASLMVVLATICLARPAAAQGGAEPVRGVALDPDGVPVSGVKVELVQVTQTWPDEIVDVVDRLFSGEDGSFEFRTPRGLDLKVIASKDQYATTEVVASPLVPELTVQLRDGYQVRGVVELPGGEPMPNCTVILEPMAIDAARALVTTSDREGGFSFANVPAGGARLTARHATLQPATLASVEVGAAKLHRLKFSTGAPPLSLNGQVVVAGEDGKPIRSARVRVLPSSRNATRALPYVTTTDDEGRFSVTGLGPGNAIVQVSHGSYSNRTRVVSVTEGSPDLLFELGPRSAVRGRLDSTAPIPAGTRIEITLKDSRLSVAGVLTVGATGERRRTTVAADGTFEFPEDLSAGTAELSLPDGEFCFEQSGSRWMTVQVEESGDTELVLDVVPPSVVRGVVRDEEGTPVPGVEVLWMQPAAGPLAPLSVLAVTDGNGAYAVRGMTAPLGFGPLGATRFVFVRRGYATAELEFAGATPGKTIDLEPVQLVRPGTIFGRVTRNGRGLAGAVVFTGHLRGMQRDVTGRDGRFSLRNLRPGGYRVKASYPTLPLVRTEGVVEVSASDLVGPVNLEVGSGRTISGRVVDPDGAPVADAVLFRRGEGSTAFYAAADGAFALEAPEGDVELQVFANGVSHVVPVAADQQQPVEVVMPLVPAGTVVARVFGLPGNRLLSGCQVRVEPIESREEDPQRAAQRDIRGRWVETRGAELRILRFPAGRSRLILQSAGYAARVVGVDVRANQVLDLRELYLEPGARVQGAVTDGSGVPITGARVFLGRELDLRSLPGEFGAITDARGRFELRGVGVASGDLIVVAEGFATRVVPLQIPSDLLRLDPLPIELSPGSTLSVSVRDADRPAEFAFVVLRRDGRVIEYAQADENGIVRFSSRGQGRYEVEALGALGSPIEVEVDGTDRVYEVSL